MLTEKPFLLLKVHQQKSTPEPTENPSKVESLKKFGVNSPRHLRLNLDMTAGEKIGSS